MIHRYSPEPLHPYEYWGDHPDYPSGDWRHEVGEKNTRLSYWQWVRAQIELKEDEA